MKKLLLVCAIGIAEIGVAACLMGRPALAQQWSVEENAAGQKTIEFTRFIPAGAKRILDPYYGINPDCTIIEDMETHISKELEHGTAELEMVERYPTFPKENVRSKCNDKKMKLQVLTYKAAIGYTGTDTFEVTFIGSNGTMTLYRYTIKITDKGAKTGRVELRP